MRSRVRRIGLAGVVVALLLGASGCGSDAPLYEGTDPPTKSAQRDEPGDPNRPDGSRTASGDRGEAEAFLRDVTAAMLEAGTCRAQASVGAPEGQVVATIEGVQRVAAEPTGIAMDISFRAEGVSGRMIVVDQTLFMGLGQLSGNKFVELDLRASAPGTEMFDQLLGSADPTAAIDTLAAAVTRFESVGADTVAGVATTEYALRVDTALLMSGGELAPGGTAVPLPPYVTYRLWVDEDELMRKVAVGASGAGVTMTLSEWGEPVDISAPPPAQITKRNPFAGRA